MQEVFETYIFWDQSRKKIRQEKNLNYNKMTWYSKRYLNYIKSMRVKTARCSQRFLHFIKCWNTPKLYTLKELLSKNWFYFFFSPSPGMKKSQHLLGCHAIDINSSVISFFKCFTFLKFNMPSQTSDNIMIAWQESCPG